MAIENVLNLVVSAATGGRRGIQLNPDFVAEQKKIQAEPRGLATRIYDAPTLFVIDDEKHVIVPRFKFVRKK